MTIPIAVFIGIYMHYLRPGKIREGTVIGVVLTLLAVVLGPSVAASPTWRLSLQSVLTHWRITHYLRLCRCRNAGLDITGSA